MFAIVFVFFVMTSGTTCHANTTVPVLASLNVSTDNVTFKIVPTEIIKNLTTEIELECLYSRVNNSTLASVLSILISQANESSQPGFFSYIASVNEIEALPHNISSDVVKLTGAIDNHGDSFLRATVRISNSNVPAHFRCEVNGFDAVGKPVTLSNTMKLQVAQNNFSLLSDELKALKTQVQQHQADIESMRNRLNVMNCTSTGYNDTTEQRLILVRQSLFYASEVYNGRRYYLLKVMDHFIYTEAQATCELHGGYLLELDDHKEFCFVSDFLQRHNYYQYVWTGATDSAHEGVWVNLHNLSSRPSFDWASGYPQNNNLQNCQCCRLFAYSWQVIDCLCSFRSVNIGEDSYICEIPE